jgi:zinc/manganese transport system substrate-binding protein
LTFIFILNNVAVMTHHKARTALATGAIGLCVSALAACGSSATNAAKDVTQPVAATPAAAPIPVVTSTNVWGDLVQRIGGDRVSITSFISDPSQDPHSYEADARNQLSLRSARLIVENGGGYDDFMDTMLKATDGGERQVLNVVDISGKQAPDGGELNEHVWYDFPTVELLVDKVVDALSTLDAADATTFHSNADALHTDLHGLEQREDAIRAKDNGKSVGITEPVPLYLLTACGLTNATPEEFSEAIEEGTDVPVAVLQQNLDLYRNHTVSALVYNEQTSGPQTEQVRDAAQQNNIPVVGVTETLPPGMSYIQWMSKNLDAIDAALT